MASDKIRLFVDAHCFDSEYQGTRTFVHDLYRELAHYDLLEIYMAAYNADELKKHFGHAKNIVFVKYRLMSKFYRLAFDIPMLIQKHKIDIAHFQYITPLVKNCTQVVTIHDVIFNDYPENFSLPYRLLKKFLYKRSTGTADIITTVSAFSKTSILKHLASHKKVHVIRNGVRKNFFTTVDKEQAKTFIRENYHLDKFILYVSRIEPRKNHLSLLNVYLRLRLYEKGYALVLIGDQTISVRQLKDRIQKLAPDMKKQLVLLNNVPNDHLEKFYRAAEVFVYPSRAEGFGLPPLEAGASQVPVICSNSSAMADYTFFEDCHVDPCDESMLENKLDQLTKNGLSEERLRQAADQIATTYSWEKSAEQFYQLLRTQKA